MVRMRARETAPSRIVQDRRHTQTQARSLLGIAIVVHEAAVFAVQLVLQVLCNLSKQFFAHRELLLANALEV